MKDIEKTKEQLIDEIQKLRRLLAETEEKNKVKKKSKEKDNAISTVSHEICDPLKEKKFKD